MLIMLVSVSGKSLVQRAVPAVTLTQTHIASRDIPSNWYCDDDVYCEDGGACCPDMVNGGFMCAGSDMWANCFLFEQSYCYGERPMICGDHCCYADEACRNGLCEARVSKALHAPMVPQLTSRFVRTIGPSLKWFPDNWGEGTMLRSIQEGLHNQFLVAIADEWRNGFENRPGQCWVIGFPAELSQCNSPWDDGCKGSDATIVQDGDMTFYNTNPILKPVNEVTLSWCNADPTQTQTHKHTYAYTETQTHEVTVEMGIKATVGMESKTTFKGDMLFASAEEELTMKFELEVSTSISESQKFEVERKWDVENTVSVGPRSHVTSSCWLSTSELSSPFEAKVKINSPIVWGCSSPENDYNYYIYPVDKGLWQSFNLESLMADRYGFSKEDLSAIFSTEIGGTWTGIVGQRVQCVTNTIELKPGETCGREHSNATLIV